MREGRRKGDRQGPVVLSSLEKTEAWRALGAEMREGRVQMQDKSQRAIDLGSNWKVRELEPMRLTSGVLLGD